MQVFSVHKNIFQETHRFFIASLANVGYSSFLAFHQSRDFLSAPKGSFRYLLQQLRNSFADVEISKPGELIHLALSIIIIVRFVDVKQYSFRLWSRWRKSPSTLLLALSTKSSRIAFQACDVPDVKCFRFGLFHQLRVPSEYRALPSE